jgi:hypothetical protein
MFYEDNNIIEILKKFKLFKLIKIGIQLITYSQYSRCLNKIPVSKDDFYYIYFTILSILDKRIF